MSKKSEVLITGRDKEELSAIEAVLRATALLSPKVRLVSNGHVDPLYGVHTMPDMLVLCLSANWCEELQELSARSLASRPPVLIVAPSGDSQVMRLAMQAGARDFFTRPVNLQELEATLSQMVEEKKLNVQSKSGLSAVINAKGGAGATLIAANLAHVMAIKADQRIALVDMDLQFGTLGLYLDLQPERGVMDALEAANELDAVAIKAYMGKHASGVHVMAATHSRVVLPGEVDAGRLDRLLYILLDNYDHVVIDLPRHIDIVTTTVLERADTVVIAMQQSFTHLRDASRLCSILSDELGIAHQQMVVAVNRYEADNPVAISDIGNRLAGTGIALIPNDYKRVSENVNLGIPLYEQSTKAPISQALVKLADQLCGQELVCKKPGLMSRMLETIKNA
jgi:pilus assembly protein CpaE